MADQTLTHITDQKWGFASHPQILKHLNMTCIATATIWNAPTQVLIQHVRYETNRYKHKNSIFIYKRKGMEKCSHCCY